MTDDDAQRSGDGGWAPPDGVPRSPSGRVPQWVLDEAAGRPVPPVPFRAWPDAAQPASRRGRRRGAVLAVVASVLALVFVLWGVRPASQPLAGPDPGAGSSAEPAVPALPTGEASPSSTPGRPDSAGPVIGFEESNRPAGLPLGDLTQRKSKGYVFTARQKDKRTGVTWSPCRPLHYVLRGSGDAPRQGERMIRESFARIAELTGLEIVDDGATKEKYDDDRLAYQPKRYGQRWAPVLVSWSTTRQDPGLEGDVLGRAGAQWVVTESGDRAYVTGTVSLDAVEINRLRSQYGYEVARAVVLHELGHLVGLGHVQDRTSLMHPEVSPAVTDFSAKDRAGLTVLGQGPCQPDV